MNTKGPKIYTPQEVSEHTSEHDAWIIVDGNVYNITDFIEEHPGGAALVKRYLGKDATKLLAGGDNNHKHSLAAYSILDGYKIGVVRDDPNAKLDEATITNYYQARKGWGKVDFNKPFVDQVGRLGNDYFKWVNEEPVHFKESVRMFGPSWMEATTHTPWYVPLLFWIPVAFIVAMVSLYKLSNFALGIGSFEASVFKAVLLFIAGFIGWFFFEYYIHKYLYHWDWLGTRGLYITNILHFLLHGMHHKVPMDKDRLVAPIVLAITIGSLIMSTLRTVGFSYYFITGFMPGLLVGYLFYDMTHYSVHHAGNPKALPWPMSFFMSTRFFQNMKRYHAIHHFATTGHLNNFGISNYFIDIVLGTLQEKYN